MVKTKIPPRDPEKGARDPGKVTHDIPRDPSPALVTCNHTHDHIRARDLTQACDLT